MINSNVFCHLTTLDEIRSVGLSENSIEGAEASNPIFKILCSEEAKRKALTRTSTAK